MAELPDRMPAGCNFYGLLETAEPAAAVARLFAAAGWRVERVAGGHRLEIVWARLTLDPGHPLVLRGWIDPNRAIEVCGMLGLPGMRLASQWVSDRGELRREGPPDPPAADPVVRRPPSDLDLDPAARADGAAVDGPGSRPRPAVWAVNPYYLAAVACAVLLPLLCYALLDVDRGRGRHGRDRTQEKPRLVCYVATFHGIPVLAILGYAFRSRFRSRSVIWLPAIVLLYLLAIYLELVGAFMSGFRL